LGKGVNPPKLKKKKERDILYPVKVRGKGELFFPKRTRNPEKKVAAATKEMGKSAQRKKKPPTLLQKRARETTFQSKTKEKKWAGAERREEVS